MHHFAYRNGVLHAEGVNLDTLSLGTPFYCYSTAALTAALPRVRRPPSPALTALEICYSP